MSSTIRSRRIALPLAIAGMIFLGLVLPLYIGRLFLLAIGADEGDIPPPSSIPAAPSDASVVSESKECASGGCWWQVVVVAAPGQSAAELATEMGVFGTLKIDGDVWDPRPVTVESDADAGSADRTLTVVARYWDDG